MSDSKIFDLAKLIEQTAEDLVSFILRSLITTFDLFFRPWKLIKEGYLCDDEEESSYTRPVVYLMLVLMLFAVFFDAIKGIVFSVSALRGMHNADENLLETMYKGRWYTEQFGLALFFYLSPPVVAVVSFAKLMSFVFFKDEDKVIARNYLIYAMALPVFIVAALIFFDNIGNPSFFLQLLKNETISIHLSDFSIPALVTLFICSCSAPLILPFKCRHKIRIHWTVYGVLVIVAVLAFAVMSANYSFWLSKRYSTNSENQFSLSVVNGTFDDAENVYLFDIVATNKLQRPLIFSDTEIIIEFLESNPLEGKVVFSKGKVLSGFASSKGPEILKSGETVLLRASFELFHRSGNADEEFNVKSFYNYNIIVRTQSIDSVGESMVITIEGYKVKSIPGWMSEIIRKNNHVADSDESAIGTDNSM